MYKPHSADATDLIALHSESPKVRVGELELEEALLRGSHPHRYSLPLDLAAKEHACYVSDNVPGFRFPAR